MELFVAVLIVWAFFWMAFYCVYNGFTKELSGVDPGPNVG